MAGNEISEKQARGIFLELIPTAKQNENILEYQLKAIYQNYKR